MKTFTIEIPNKSVDEFINYINNFPNASILNQNNFYLTEEQLKMLEENAKIPNSECITKEEMLNNLKNKLECMK